MSVVLVTGAGGLIGSEAAEFFAGKGMEVVGIDNDMRRYFFGETASTAWKVDGLIKREKRYRHEHVDIRDLAGLTAIFERYASDIHAIIHAAAQPSHDWAAREPLTDFTVNALGTVNLLELTRKHCPEASFIFTSTNKVYGDSPNRLPLEEQATRWELKADHPFNAHGIDETMSIDDTLHSLFGASKVSADVYVQEYGRYFGLHTACFRGGCLTGPAHSAAELHGFLAYLVRCAVTDQSYTVFGYKGKQVRDNIHSFDLVNAFWHFVQAKSPSDIYNIGGGRHVNCSMIEAIELIETTLGRPMSWTYSETNRTGDHMWWISDTRRFEDKHPDWRRKYALHNIVEELCDEIKARENA